jgi:RHS repeat-associated protein
VTLDRKISIPRRPASRPRRADRPSLSGIAILCSVALLGPMIASVLPAATAGAAGAAVTYTYDAAGRLASVTTASGTATYHYDAEGNLLSTSTSTGGPSGRAAGSHRSATAAPVVTSARPSTVAPGGTVTIRGRRFSDRAREDVVRIGALLAPVTRATTTMLEVTAPPGSGGLVRVTTPGGTAAGPSVKVAEADSSAEQLPAGTDPHPLRATAGVTAVSGLVEDNHGTPLAGVQISVLSVGGSAEAETATNSSGQFLIAHLSAGRHQLVISGNSTGNGRHYGVYAEPVELPAARTTVMPWVTYLTPLDLSHAVTLTSPTTHEVTVTTPKIPGLEIEIPKGTVIRDHDGQVVTKVSITPLTVGRTPYPLAPGMQPGFFTLQPGDASVSGPGLRVIYANGTDQPPGTAIPYFIDSPNWAGTGWWRYGTGYVSANGKQIDPGRGVHWNAISLGGYGTNPPPGSGPPPGGCGGSGGGGGGGGGGGAGSPPGASCPIGDPVDPSSGLFVYQATDLSLADVEGVTLGRIYRQLDDTVRDFGIGMSSTLNFYIVASANGDFDLYLPNGGSIAYAPTGTTGLYQSVGSPTVFVGSTLTWTGGDPDGPFTIQLTDGSVLYFDNPAYLTKMTDRFGNSIIINRNELTSNGGQIESVTTPDGLWMKFTYGNCVAASASTTCITSVEDNSGRTLTYTYDPDGRMLTATDPAGGTTHYSWAACTSTMTCTELLSVTDPDGHVTTNTYDPTTGRITSQVDGDGGTWTFSYETNDEGQITQTDVTDPRGIEDTYSFGADGYLTSMTDAVGTTDAQTTTTVFNTTTNLLTSETDPLGRTTTYGYDALGNVTSVTELAGTADATTETFTYDPTYSRLTSITDPLGETTTITYDDAADSATVTDSLGNQWLVNFNDEGQPIELTNPLGESTYLSYLYGDLVAVANPLDETTGTYYDSVGQPLQETDAEGNTTSYTWTPLGQLATETSPIGAVTSYSHDPDGNLTGLTDADGNTTTFAYDDDDNMVKTTDALGKSYDYTYDADGNVSAVTDADGNKNTFAYDDLNRLTTAKYGVSGKTEQTSITFSYDAGDRITKAVDSSSGTDSFTYDGFNDVLKETTPQGTVSHTYNDDALATSMSVSNQTKVTYTYDKDDRLTGITQGSAKVSLGYDTDSRPTSVTLPDGIVGTTVYNAASNPTSQTFDDGATQVGALDYTYDTDGQVTSEAGSLASAELPAAVTGDTYNADNELVKSDGTAYSYDANGNLTSNGTDTFSWNAQRELTSISGATTAAFTYNPFGQQATADVGGTTTSSLYDGTSWDSNVVQELSGTTPTENLLTGAADQIFQLTTPSGTNSSFLTNPLGSTIALASSAGALTTDYSYDPNGTVTTTGASSPNTFEFNGTQNDGTGLYLMGARYYDPTTGSFISQDPTGFKGGTTNLYGFAQNDPINLNDPTGCGCSWPEAGPGKLFPPLEGWGSAIGAFAGAALVVLLAPELLAAGALGAIAIGIWGLDGAIIGGLIGTACNVS